jgi:AraC family transcriptional regulator, glycine betaine-responsive activator
MNDKAAARQFWLPPVNAIFSFVLLPRFSLLALAGAIEPLRHANQALGKAHYRWQLFSEDGQSIQSSSSIEVSPTGCLQDVPLDGNVIVVGGADILAASSKSLVKWLRHASVRAPLIGGLCTATRILAETGLLDGHKATIHWEMVESLKETFQDVIVTDNLFEIDHNRLTCAGETACTDMMLNLISAAHGREIAALVAAQVLHARVRSWVEPQASLVLRTGTRNTFVLKAIAIMESQIDNRLEIETIARSVGCSRRQLERLFSEKVGAAPMTYYRNISLDRARQLLCETRMSHLEVAVACGFESSAAFSTAYRRRFGTSPTAEERMSRNSSKLASSRLNSVSTVAVKSKVDIVGLYNLKT